MSDPRPEGLDASRAGSGEATVETGWQRQRRLAAVYGEVLPESTSDDRDDPTSGSESEDWLRAQVPPHHG